MALYDPMSVGGPALDGDIRQGPGLQQPLHVRDHLGVALLLLLLNGPSVFLLPVANSATRKVEITINIKQKNPRGSLRARDGHLADDGEGVVIDVVVIDEDVADAPAPAVVVAVLLPVAVIVHEHLLLGPLVQEGDLELERVDVVLVGGHLVEVDRHVSVDRDVAVILVIVMVRVFLVLGSSVWQESQIPAGLLAVSLTIKSVSIVDKNKRKYILHLDCEGAGLDAVIPLDALLLPLIVRDVPRELELGVAHAAGAAPGRGGRGCSAPVTLLKYNTMV